MVTSVEERVLPLQQPTSGATPAYPDLQPRLGPSPGVKALRHGAVTLSFALAYFVTGLASRWTAPDHGQVVLVAPAAGVAVVWLLASRRRTLDTLLLVAVAGGYHALTLADLTAVPLHMTVALVQTLVAVALLRRVVPDPRSASSALVTTGLVWRSLLSVLLAASVGATVLVLGLATGVAPELDEVATWLSFVGRNATAMTVLVLLGLLLVAPQRVLPEGRSVRTRAVLRVVAVVTLTAGLYLLVFVSSGLPIAFLTLLLTLWVASVSTPLMATLHATLSGMGVTLMTALGYGSFAAVADPVARAGVVQMFVFALFVMGLVVATERQQQRLVAEEVQRQRQRAEDQSALLTVVLDSLNEAVLVLGADGRPTLANRPGRRWLQMREEVVRRTGSLRLHDSAGRLVEPTDLPSARALRGEEVAGVDLSLRDTAGELHVHAVTARPLPTGDRERAAAVVVHRDVTEVRAQQDRLSAFAGIVAHDLKNPLSSISTWAELLEMELADHHCGRSPAPHGGVPEAADALRGIHRASRRMARLIDRLLAQARSQSTVLQRGVVDLTDLVNRVVAERRLDAVVTLPAPLPLVRGDEVLVTQLVDNLLGNAAKYVAPGVTPRITVTAELVDDEVEVRVTDNGIGIPPADRPRVFDEFYRAHAERYEGTGLGLAICRVIVERHGGRIVVDEAPTGTGSCFCFSLPAASPH